jgi:hypothetical protein
MPSSEGDEMKSSAPQQRFFFTSTKEQGMKGFAPTKSTVKEKSGRTLSQSGYLEGLKTMTSPSTSLLSTAPAAASSSPSSASLDNSQQQKSVDFDKTKPDTVESLSPPAARKKNFAPTPPSVKYRSGATNSTYLRSLQQGDTILVVSYPEEAIHPLPEVAALEVSRVVEAVAPELWRVVVPSPVKKAGGDWSITKSSVKHLSTQTSPFLEQLGRGGGGGVTSLPSFAGTKEPAMAPAEQASPKAEGVVGAAALKPPVVRRSSWTTTAASVKNIDGLSSAYLQNLRGKSLTGGTYPNVVSRPNPQATMAPPATVESREEKAVGMPHGDHDTPTDNDLISQGNEIVQKAIEADKAGAYRTAVVLYRDALSHLTTGLKSEKDSPQKFLLLDEVEGYMTRAEELVESGWG